MQFPRIRVILSAADVAVFAHGKLKGTMSSGGGGTDGAKIGSKAESFNYHYNYILLRLILYYRYYY